MNCDPPIPENIFDLSVYTPDVMREYILFFSIWLRENKQGRTYDQYHRKMAMLSDSISNIISNLHGALGELDYNLIPLLSRDRSRPTIQTKVLTGMKRIDATLRGHRDRFCTIPCGIAFVELMLIAIAEIYATDLTLRILYSLVTVFEYMLGDRTYEVFVKNSNAHNHLPACVSIEQLEYDPSYPEVQEAASIHSVVIEDIQFGWPNGQILLASETNKLPPEYPDRMFVYGSKKNNPFGTKSPTTIVVNPLLPNSSPLCLVTEMYTYIKNNPRRASTEKLFQGVHNHQFTKIMKQVAVQIGYPPDRIHTTSFRCGCASATTSDSLNMIQQQLTTITQHHQQWLTPRGSLPYHYDMLMDGVVKTCQLYDYRANNFAYVLARFVTRFHK